MGSFHLGILDDFGHWTKATYGNGASRMIPLEADEVTSTTA